MPTQVLPITDIASLGVIEDTPNYSLPPNAFSDVQNVRFRDGAIRKMTGENEIFIDTMFDGEVVYIAHWPSSAGDRYVIVERQAIVGSSADSMYSVRAFEPDGTEVISRQIIITSTADTPRWQHTLFNGGFHFILNSAISTPVYLSADAANAPTLPGWASYAVEEAVSDFIYNGEMGDFTVVDARLTDGASVRIEVTPRNVSAPIRTTVLTISGGMIDDGTVIGLGTASLGATGEGVPMLVFTPAATNGGAAIRITISTQPITGVTAGVIRAYGNLLVAGNLQENGPGSRTLTGTIRTSDVAGPGEIPRNWNPFRLGVNTADEFTLASTGTIQDLVELQGNLYVYTDSSIHAIQQTGSPIIPFQITPVTDNYGVDNTGGVLEVDGKHIVVGSDDVYVFSGHPGSIQSIADARVRHRDIFRGTFAADQGIQIIRFSRYDELWFWRPRVADMYVWNYRDNTWTRRVQSTPKSGNMGVNSPVFINNSGDADEIYETDSANYLGVNGSTYSTYIERQKMALTPEFDTENLASIALLIDGDGRMNIRVIGTANSGATVPEFTDARKGGYFDILTEYKQDIREHGRFLSYRMTHDPADTDNGFSMTGFQLDIGKGGTR